jgi:hypothetical protein
MDLGQHGADRVEIQANGVLGRKKRKERTGPSIFTEGNGRNKDGERFPENILTRIREISVKSLRVHP